MDSVGFPKDDRDLEGRLHRYQVLLGWRLVRDGAKCRSISQKHQQKSMVFGLTKNS